MANFFDLLKKGINSLNPVSWVGDVIGGVTSLISNNQANKNANHLADKQIAAQQQMNERNVAAQEKINADNIAAQERVNQSQIDFQQGINDIMRRDSQHAISDKRNDLMRAGYSTADPSLQGFSAASLSSPTLNAPQSVAPTFASEFPSDIARTLIDSKRSSIDNYTTLASTLSDIALKRAQTSKTKSEIVNINKNNEWLDLEKDVNFSILMQNLENSFKDGNIKQYQADMLANDLTTFKTKFDILQTQLSNIKIENESLAKRLSASLQETLARVINIKANTRNTELQHDLLSIDKELKGIELDFAKLGINFNASDLYSSIARVCVSGNSSTIVNSVIDTVKSITTTLIQQIASLPRAIFNF